MRPDNNELVDDDHEHEDGCLCDLEIPEEDTTNDVELPPASGGVQEQVIDLPDDEAGEGCDAVLEDKDTTEDTELPAATLIGG
jgi:hypothetical protein